MTLISVKIGMNCNKKSCGKCHFVYISRFKTHKKYQAGCLIFNQFLKGNHPYKRLPECLAAEVQE